MAVPILRLEGRSGCLLEIQSRSGIYCVTKKSVNEGYNQRLLNQAKKQQEFKGANATKYFLTPEIIEISRSDENPAWFTMRYIAGAKYSDFLERSSFAEIRSLSEKYIIYFETLMDAATVQKAEAGVFYAKLNSLAALKSRPDLDQGWIETVFDYLQKYPAGEIPIGKCHGDFTFSNMLFSGPDIYLLDFLDSFIESPLIDLVKFRQDSFFYWSLLIDDNLAATSKARVIQIMQFLDREIMAALSKNDFVLQWYTYLQVFNLIRILPYVKKQAEINFVQNSINRILT